MVQVTCSIWPPCLYMVKNPQKLFYYRTNSPIIMKLGMEFLCIQAVQSLYKWWPWFDIGLFYVDIKSGETCFRIYSRQKYQASVYRTIGPLVNSETVAMKYFWIALNYKIWFQRYFIIKVKPFRSLEFSSPPEAFYQNNTFWNCCNYSKYDR